MRKQKAKTKLYKFFGFDFSVRELSALTGLAQNSIRHRIKTMEMFEAVTFDMNRSDFSAFKERAVEYGTARDTVEKYMALSIQSYTERPKIEKEDTERSELRKRFILVDVVFEENSEDGITKYKHATIRQSELADFRKTHKGVQTVKYYEKRGF